MRSSAKRRNKMTVVDVFCGCGGMSLGFQNAGFRVVAGYDNWELATTSYSSNFDHDVHQLDLGNVKAAAEHIAQYNPDTIIGGPPCQDFSIAGKRLESRRADLTVSYAKVVSLLAPKLMVMENVYSIEKSKALRAAERILKNSGYGITRRVIDASLTGVPQKRRRFFLIASRDLPDDAFGEVLEANLAKEPMTVHDYFGDELGTEFYYAHPRSYKRRAIFSVHEPSVTIRRVNRPIPANYVQHPADKAAVSDGVRPLTTSERAGIQTFPPDYVFIGSKSQQEHLLANAVPVKLAQYVAEQITKVLGR